MILKDVRYPTPILNCTRGAVMSMHKIITMIFFLFLLLVKPVYAGNSFQYSRVIKTDNSTGYKSIVLDKSVFTHSNDLNDLRIINDRDEEVPYLMASIRDASTETEKESFIRSEEAQYSYTQEGTDSVITLQVNHLNTFRLELNTDDKIERTYGLFGVKQEITSYLSEGRLFSVPPSDSSVNIEWTSNPPIDKLRLIIHNGDSEPINLKSITVKYHLNKLVFKHQGNGQLWLVYGNDTLRPPIYEALNYKAIIASEHVTETALGSEVKTTSNTNMPLPPTKYELLTISTIMVLVLLSVGVRLRKRKRK